MAASPVAAAPPRTTLKVLLAEDERVSQMVNTAVLEREGHTVTVVADGQAAVDAVAGSAFDLVLMDLRMPGLDGAAAVRRIRDLPDGERAAVPIAVLTASALASDIDAARDAGADAILSKPLQWEALRPVLDRILTGYDVAVETGATASDPVSDAPLRQMLDYLPPQRVAGLIDSARKSLGENASAVAAAWAAGDHGRTADHAHRIAGVAGSYGCIGLRGAAQALDRALGAGHPDPAPLVAALAAATPPALAFLEGHRRTLNTGD